MNTVSQLIVRVEDIQNGALVSESYIFTEEVVKSFGALVGDTAPIHWDNDFAIRKSFRGRIVYGFFVAAPLSKMLGMTLPGPHTVIHSVNYKIHRPVYIGQKINYFIKVTKTVPSVGVVILDLSARNEFDETVLTGAAQCGFPREASYEVQ